MVSKDYLSYLFKSKKVLVVFVTLIFLLLGIVTDSYFSRFTNYLFATLLCFVLPCLLFMHVHDKRAIDTYYSLPLKREAILVTSIIFMLIVVYVPYTLSTVISILKDYGFLFDISIFTPALGFMALIIINSLLFMFGNNIFDGAVMIGSYQVLPIIIFMTLVSVGTVFVAGFNESQLGFIKYISPVVNAYFLSYNLAEMNEKLISLAITVIYVILSSFFLYRSYCYRKAERAGTSSNYVFAYPTVINLYAFMIILAFTSSLFEYENLFEAISENFIFYVVVFAIYIAAQFVYRRQFYFNYKMLIFFFGSIILSLLIGYGLDKTDGLHLAYNYEKFNNANIYINNNYYEGVEDPELKEYLVDNFEYKTDDFMYLNISRNKIGPVGDDLYSKVDEYRQRMINDFYNDKRGTFYSSSSLNIDDDNEDLYYYYRSNSQLSLKEIMEFAEFIDVTVIFETNKASYRVMPDGNIVLVEKYDIYD